MAEEESEIFPAEILDHLYMPENQQIYILDNKKPRTTLDMTSIDGIYRDAETNIWPHQVIKQKVKKLNSIVGNEQIRLELKWKKADLNGNRELQSCVVLCNNLTNHG